LSNKISFSQARRRQLRALWGLLARVEIVRVQLNIVCLRSAGRNEVSCVRALSFNPIRGYCLGPASIMRHSILSANAWPECASGMSDSSEGAIHINPGREPGGPLNCDSGRDELG